MKLAASTASLPSLSLTDLSSSVTGGGLRRMTLGADGSGGAALTPRDARAVLASPAVVAVLDGIVWSGTDCFTAGAVVGRDM